MFLQKLQTNWVRWTSESQVLICWLLWYIIASYILLHLANNICHKYPKKGKKNSWLRLCAQLPLKEDKNGVEDKINCDTGHQIHMRCTNASTLNLNQNNVLDWSTTKQKKMCSKTTQVCANNITFSPIIMMAAGWTIKCVRPGQNTEWAGWHPENGYMSQLPALWVSWIQKDQAESIAIQLNSQLHIPG